MEKLPELENQDIVEINSTYSSNEKFELGWCWTLGWVKCVILLKIFLFKLKADVKISFKTFRSARYNRKSCQRCNERKKAFLLTFYWTLLKFATLQAWAESWPNKILFKECILRFQIHKYWTLIFQVPWTNLKRPTIVGFPWPIYILLKV